MTGWVWNQVVQTSGLNGVPLSTLILPVLPALPYHTMSHFESQVMATIRTGSPIARMLFDRAYAYKKACLLRGDPSGGRWGAIYDRLIFSKVPW